MSVDLNHWSFHAEAREIDWNFTEPDEGSLRVAFAAAAPLQGPPAKIAAVDAHNAAIRAAEKRLDELESRLADLLVPILEAAGREAAKAFEEKATAHLVASLRQADREAERRDHFRNGWPEVFGKGFGVRLRPAVITAAGQPGVTSTSTMICVKPRPAEAAAIAAADGLDPETLHVTLAFLGDVEGDLLTVVDALRPVAASHAPLSGVVGGAGIFAPGVNGGGPTILLPDVPGLVELRVAATEALANAGIEYGRDHGFAAHITVDYYDQPDEATADETTMLAPLHFDALLIVRSDTEIIELPLVGVPPLTAATYGLVDEFLEDLITAMTAPVGEMEAAVGERRALRAAGPPPFASPAGDELLDVDGLISTLRTKTDPVRRALVEAAMTPGLAAAGLNFDVTNPFTAKVLAGSGSQIKGIAETTRLNVMRVVKASYANGLSIPDTAKAIREGMAAASPARATLIARTELSGGANGGSLAAMQIVTDATGDQYSKRWLTAPGAPHPRHEDYDGLDGQTQPLDGPFDVGGFALQYPGDPDGDAGEVCNCRCSMTFALPGEDPTTVSADDGGFDLSDAGAAAAAQADTVSVGAGAPVPFALRQQIETLGLDRPLDDLKPTTALGEEIYANASTTKELHTVGGDYTPERKALHAQIIAKHFEGKDLVGPETPSAYFTAGGGASGKSAALFGVGGQDLGLSDLGGRSDTVWIDPDRVKKMLPEYKALTAENDFYAANGVHEESSDISAAIAAETKRRGLSYIQDTTGGSSTFVGKIQAAKAAGYNTQVSMFSIPTNDAIKRSLARALNPGSDSYGRFVALRPLKDAHAGASRNLAIWKDDPATGAWRVYDNSGATPVLVADQNGIYDQDVFSAILAKASEGPVG